MDDEIKALVRESFDEEDYDLVLSELNALDLSHVMANSQSQLDSVLKGILKLSEGDLNRISTYVAAVFFKIVVAFLDYAATFSCSARLGFNATSPTGDQFLDAPDQRSGWRALACV